MEIVAITLIILSIAFFVGSGVLISLGHEYGFPFSGISFMFFGILFLLIGIFLYYFINLYFYKRLNKEHFALSKKISGTYIQGSKTIIFTKEKQSWKCEFSNEVFSFNTRFCVFKKSFIYSFVSRSIRYRLISNRQKIRNIGKHKLYGLNKSLNATIEFRTKHRTINMIVCENGISKMRFISWLNLKICLPPSLEYRTPRNMSIGNQIWYLDEEKLHRLMFLGKKDQ